MNRDEFVRTLAAEYGMTIGESKEICEAVLAHMRRVIEKEDLSIFGFGTFKHKFIKEHKAIHPQTGEVIMVPAKDRIKFIPSVATTRAIGGK